MTWRLPSPYEEALMGYPCDTCGAGEGQWCTTSGKRQSAYLHSPRVRRYHEHMRELERQTTHRRAKRL